MDKASQDKKPNLHLGRTALLFAVIIVAIVVIFESQLLLQTQSGLAASPQLSSESVNATGTAADFKPFAALEENCTSCHTERRFTGVHGDMGKLHKIVNEMETKPQAGISQKETDRIHDSVQFLKCVVCHDESQMKSMAGMTSVQRTEVIRRMQQKPSADISEADARGIENAMHNIQGF